jgi:hypothetical protein
MKHHNERQYWEPLKHVYEASEQETEPLKHVYEASEQETILGITIACLVNIRTRDNTENH